MTNLRGISERLARQVLIGTLACAFVTPAALAQHNAYVLIFDPPLAVRGPHFCKMYPRSAVRAGEQGETFVELTIGTDGAVKNSVVAKSSGHADLDQATINCTSTFAYQPIMKDGVPVETTATAAIAWCLSDECRALFAPSATAPALPATASPGGETP